VQADTDIVATVAAGWVEDTGGFSAPAKVITPVSGRFNAKPIANGAVIIYPVLGSASVMRSADNGLTWTHITLPSVLGDFNSNYDCVENLAYGGGVWVLTDSSAAQNYIFISSDNGLTWTQASTTTAQQWGCPVYNGNIWVITSLQATTQAIVTSTLGTTWTYSATALPIASRWGKPVWNGSIWVVTQGNSMVTLSSTVLATSTDGTTWISRTIPAYSCYTPLWNGTHWLITTPASIGALSNILHSYDGITWLSKNLPVNVNCKAPVWNGLIWAILGNSGSNSYIFTSDDGLNWVYRAYYNYLTALNWLPNMGMWFCPASTGYPTVYSYDGYTWQSNTGFYSDSYYTVTSLGNMAIALGATTGTYYVSFNGINWIKKVYLIRIMH